VVKGEKAVNVVQEEIIWMIPMSKIPGMEIGSK
jgi:hypothetical protein